MCGEGEGGGYFKNPGFHVLSGGDKQSVMGQLNSELSIDKVLTDHFSLKLFYLIFKNDQVKHGDNYYYGALPKG